MLPRLDIAGKRVLAMTTILTDTDIISVVFLFSSAVFHIRTFLMSLLLSSIKAVHSTIYTTLFEGGEGDTGVEGHRLIELINFLVVVHIILGGCDEPTEQLRSFTIAQAVAVRLCFVAITIVS